jgi:hypothetical protein
MNKELPSFIELKAKPSNKIYTEAFRMEHCLAWKKSGLSRGQYCAKNNLARTNLSTWLKKYFQEKNENTPPELTEENLPKKQSVEIILSNGLRLKFEEISDENQVAKIIQTLSHATEFI